MNSLSKYENDFKNYYKIIDFFNIKADISANIKSDVSSLLMMAISSDSSKTLNTAHAMGTAYTDYLTKLNSEEVGCFKSLFDNPTFFQGVEENKASITYLESVVAFLACNGVLTNIFELYPNISELKKDILELKNDKTKTYLSYLWNSFYILDDNLKCIESPYKSNLKNSILELGDIINIQKTTNLSCFIPLYQSLVELLENLKEKSSTILLDLENSSFVDDAINEELKHIINYLEFVLRPAFEDIPTCLVTPKGLFAEHRLVLENPSDDKIGYLNLRSIKNKNVIRINELNEITKCYMGTLYNFKTSENLIMMDSPRFSIKYSDVKNYYMYPYLMYQLIVKRCFKFNLREDGKVDISYIFCNTITELINVLQKSLRDFIILILNDILKNGNSNSSLKNEEKKIYNYLTMYNSETSNLDDYCTFTRFLRELLVPFTRIGYIFSSISENTSNLDIIVGLHSFNITEDVKRREGSNKLEQIKSSWGKQSSKDIMSYVYKELKQSGKSTNNIEDTFKLLKLSEICEVSTMYEYVRGFYSSDTEREAREILFAYKKYDSLFLNNVQLRAKLLLGRNETTRQPIYWDLETPQNIVNSVIAGSGSGKGVLTLAALVNLYVGNYPTIYADFKPDMGATLCSMSESAQVPIYTIDGKDGFSASEDGTFSGKHYIGNHNEFDVILDGEPINKQNSEWFGYDRVLDCIDQKIYNIIPYLKTMQLFLAFGLARKNEPNMLKELPISDEYKSLMKKFMQNGYLVDNRKKMFLILDEAQLANTVYDGCISIITNLKKEHKDDDDIQTFTKSFERVFINNLASDMKDIVVTTGRVAKMGIILIGQQVDPGQWSAGGRPWKESTFGYLLGNSSQKLIGKNGGISPTYGMPKIFSNDPYIGKELGYWALTNQVRSGDDATAKGLKTYLILNKNDVQVGVSPDQQKGAFTAGLFNSCKTDKDAKNLYADLTKIDQSTNEVSIRENVGFEAMLRQFARTEEDYKAYISYTYFLFEGFLKKAGIVGEDAPYSNLYSYLYSVNPEYFFTAAELEFRFKSDNKNLNLNVSTNSEGIQVIPFLADYAKVEKSIKEFEKYEKDPDDPELEYLAGINFSYTLLKKYADESDSKLSDYWELERKELESFIEQTRKEIESLNKKSDKTKEDNEKISNLENILLSSENQLSKIDENKDRARLVFKKILEEVNKGKGEKFNSWGKDETINPSVVYLTFNESPKKEHTYTKLYKQLLEEHYKPFQSEVQNKVYYNKSNKNSLEKTLMTHTGKLKEKSTESEVNNITVLCKTSIDDVFNNLEISLKKERFSKIDLADASLEAKEKVKEVLLSILNFEKSNIFEKFEKAIRDKTVYALETKEELETKSEIPEKSEKDRLNGTENEQKSELDDKIDLFVSDDDDNDDNDVADGDAADGDDVADGDAADGDDGDAADGDDGDAADNNGKNDKNDDNDRLQDSDRNKEKNKGKDKVKDESFFTPQTQDPPHRSSGINKQRINSVIDTQGLKYNTDNVDKMGNVKAIHQITDMIIKDIKRQFGGVNNIDSIGITSSGCLIINNYTYSPKFPETFMKSLGQGIYNDVSNGAIIRVTNIGAIVASLMSNIYILSIETPVVANSNLFKKELGIHRDYGELFRQYQNLQEIYLPNEELIRNNLEVNTQSGSGLGLGSKIASLFSIGQGKGSRDYIPDPKPEYNGNTFIDRAFESKPVRVLTGALGWTLGCKAVVLAATLFGPWGLLFGGLAAAGAYKEIKNDRINNGYTSNRSSNGYSSNKNSNSNSKKKRSNNQKDEEL